MEDRLAIVSPLDPYELMCRMIEAVTGETRPKHMSAQEAIEWFTSFESRDQLKQMARGAITYFGEMVTPINDGKSSASPKVLH